MPVVSIVTPCYNSSLYISEAIESVISQKYKDWEMIIVDDASSDKSIDLIDYYIKLDPRIRLIKLQENSGAAVARNAAMKDAKGRYIAFLDSDDIWHSDKLDTQIAFMKENNMAFSYSSYYKIDENGSVIDEVGVPEKVTYTDLLKVCSIGCLTAMYDTKLVGRIDMPLIRKRQDLGLWLRVLKKTDYAYGISEPLAKYRIRSDSISSNKIVAAKYTWRLYKEVECLPFLKAVFYFSHYAFNGILRTKFPKIARILGLL
ncbi:glycosyltransferase family 2 protein [Marinomonas ostreistagni]|uniref:glycosyltransferase family 2 protein n=1 Tax=Marinomonas ostreistagni TaxID=359209 RepID=UPI00194EA825|nr:glycosyltransferase family 2 protein [Marinomonas ostreistagni]MBM6551063.1 glycosyltransferase family 2 protein [Marinomonas ostreistagni]